MSRHAPSSVASGVRIWTPPCVPPGCSSPRHEPGQHHLEGHWWPAWADVVAANAATPRSALRLVRQLGASEAAASRSAGCSTLGGAGMRCAGRQAHKARPPPCCRPVETALAGLERPLAAYLVELEPDRAEGRRGTAARGGELVEWRPILERAGVTRAEPRRRRLPRARGARPGAPGSRTMPLAWTRRPTARRCGPGCSTCTTRCTARRSTICAPSPPDALRRVRLAGRGGTTR